MYERVENGVYINVTHNESKQEIFYVSFKKMKIKADLSRELTCSDIILQKSQYRHLNYRYSKTVSFY